MLPDEKCHHRTELYACAHMLTRAFINPSNLKFKICSPQSAQGLIFSFQFIQNHIECTHRLKGSRLHLQTVGTPNPSWAHYDPSGFHVRAGGVLLTPPFDRKGALAHHPGCFPPQRSKFPVGALHRNCSNGFIYVTQRCQERGRRPV